MSIIQEYISFLYESNIDETFTLVRANRAAVKIIKRQKDKELYGTSDNAKTKRLRDKIKKKLRSGGLTKDQAIKYGKQLGKLQHRRT